MSIWRDRIGAAQAAAYLWPRATRQTAEPVPADSAALFGARPWILDRDLARRLWSKSEAWTGVRMEG
jgi:hypothetical protein